jgi:hypothetical protein
MFLPVLPLSADDKLRKEPHCQAKDFACRRNSLEHGYCLAVLLSLSSVTRAHCDVKNGRVEVSIVHLHASLISALEGAEWSV